MPRQTHVEKSSTKQTKTEETAPEPKVSKSTEELKAESDALMDEIDELLATSEIDATQFLQKGGE